MIKIEEKILERETLIRLLCESTLKSEICSKETHEDCRTAKGDCAFCAITADFLIENGVIVPPCKVGDTVYYAGIDTPIKFTVIGFSKGRMYDCSVADYEEFVEDNELNIDEWYVHLDSFCGLKQMSPLSSFGKRLFVGDDAEKQAEQALAERMK